MKFFFGRNYNGWESGTVGAAHYTENVPDALALSGWTNFWNKRRVSRESLMVRPGSCVTVYEEKNYGGKSKSYCANTTEIENEWQKKITSFRITEGK